MIAVNDIDTFDDEDAIEDIPVIVEPVKPLRQGPLPLEEIQEHIFLLIDAFLVLNPNPMTDQVDALAHALNIPVEDLRKTIDSFLIEDVLVSDELETNETMEVIEEDEEDETVFDNPIATGQGIAQDTLLEAYERTHGYFTKTDAREAFQNASSEDLGIEEFFVEEADTEMENNFGEQVDKNQDELTDNLEVDGETPSLNFDDLSQDGTPDNTSKSKPSANDTDGDGA